MYSEYYDCILNVIYMLVCAAGQKESLGLWLDTVPVQEDRGWGVLQRRQVWANLHMSACSLHSPRLYPLHGSTSVRGFFVSDVNKAQLFWS